MSLIFIDFGFVQSADSSMKKVLEFPQSEIEASRAQCIKLGSEGVWEATCIAEGSLRLGYYEVPHEMALSGDKDAITRLYIERGLIKSAASSHARQVLEFYDISSSTLWITFHKGYLYWCRSDAPVEYLGSDPATNPLGSRVRKTLDGWHSCDIRGNPILVRDLSGKLAAAAGQRNAICKVHAFDHLIGKINDTDLPEVSRAREARASLISSTHELIRLLSWKDFELLVEMVFTQSGWRREGATGGTQKTVDIELVLPSTGERAFVQVKSKTSQRELDGYVEELEGRPEARMFYAYHTSSSEISCQDPRVTLVDRSQLSELVFSAGLYDWILKRAA